MGVIQEWHWLCEHCDAASEEPRGSQDEAQAELDEHMAEDHSEQGDDDA